MTPMFQDPIQATLEKYTKNMRLIIKKLKTTNARLIFAPTTPVAPGTLNPLRTSEAPVQCNSAAVKLMDSNGIQVNDLNAFALPHLAEWQMPKNVHFWKAGSQALAERSNHC